jgi:hypothetical protein
MKTTALFKIGVSTLAIAATSTLALAEVNQPQEIIMRPMTTPGGQITIMGDLPILIAPDPIGTAIGLGVGGAYGVSDKIEVGVGYGLSLKEFEAKGDLAIEGAFNIMEGNLGVAANLTTGYNLLAEGLDPLGIGARVRFRLNDKLAIVSPGSQLSIALDGDPKPITLGLPVGVAFQASPQIYAWLTTELANISISNSSTVVFGADYIPVTAGAFFSPSNTMDLGASISWFDLKEASDTLIIGLHGRLHI